MSMLGMISKCNCSVLYMNLLLQSRILETSNSGFSLPISSAFSHLASLCMLT